VRVAFDGVEVAAEGARKHFQTTFFQVSKSFRRGIHWTPVCATADWRAIRQFFRNVKRTLRDWRLSPTPGDVCGGWAASVVEPCDRSFHLVVAFALTHFINYLKPLHPLMGIIASVLMSWNGGESCFFNVRFSRCGPEI